MGVAVLWKRPRGRFGSGLMGAAGNADSVPWIGFAATALGDAAMADVPVSIPDSRNAETGGFGLLVIKPNAPLPCTDGTQTNANVA